jgi:hypothetical protein
LVAVALGEDATNWLAWLKPKITSTRAVTIRPMSRPVTILASCRSTVGNNKKISK